MAVVSSQANVERTFHHPFKPYDIQMQFMNAVYECLEGGKVGIFESPTGTGKSLSLICGSLTWLRDHKRAQYDDESVVQYNENEPGWVLEHMRTQNKQAAAERKAELEARLTKIRAKENRARARYEETKPPAKRLRTAESITDGNDDAIFLLDDYESDDEEESSTDGKKGLNLGLSVETQALMEKLGMGLSSITKEDMVEEEDEMKIFYCSRTHSQLTQFSNELRRVKLPPAITLPPPRDEKASDHDIITEEVKYLTLGSRKNLCINSKVAKLGNVTAINERCLELQQSSTPADHKCTFLPTKEKEMLVNDFRDHALASIRDIEDIATLGRKISICPYYASREATKPAEIVSLPYQLLLQKSAREALDIPLKGHVVIIDEAHNVMDAISNIHSVSISLDQVEKSRAQLMIYLQRFRNRLKGKNRVYIAQLVRLLDSLSEFLEAKHATSGAGEYTVHVGDLLAAKAADQVNLYKLMRYLQESRLARKVDGYIVHADQNGEKPTISAKPAVTMPCLMLVQRFLWALTYPAAEGRFFFSKEQDSPLHCKEHTLLKYLLLDPTHDFKEIVDDSRSVILAGGTMAPMSDYANHLLHYLPQGSILTLSCGHVIPRTNLLACTLANGPTGIEFDFSFSNRSNSGMLTELGETLVRLSRIIPDGLVVFFPSYSMLDTSAQHWQKPPTQSRDASISTWSRLSTEKTIFRERHSSSIAGLGTKHASVDEVLAAYAAHINAAKGKGALLLAVIGGSLSEGINFSDRLGRGIVVVGLPFPNPHSAQWKAKLEYIEQKKHRNSLGTTGSGKAAAREYYENACMRAVNQSIGRAIRHKDDYAAIIMLDARYRRDGIRGKLPHWIRDSLMDPQAKYEGVAGALEEFFAGKQPG